MYGARKIAERFNRFLAIKLFIYEPVKAGKPLVFIEINFYINLYYIKGTVHEKQVRNLKRNKN